MSVQESTGAETSRITRFLPARIQKLCDITSFGDVFGEIDQPEGNDLITGDTTEIRNRLNDLWS